MCAVPVEARRCCWILWNFIYRRWLATTWVLGAHPESSTRAVSALSSEPSLQSHMYIPKDMIFIVLSVHTFLGQGKQLFVFCLLFSISFFPLKSV